MADGRPVTAAPQSLAYRVRRFVRRNRGKSRSPSALLLTLVAGVAATAWQARIAAVERDKAQHRFRQVREFSRALIFDVHDALRTVPGATEPRRLLLDRAVQFLDGLAAGAGADNALKLELAEGYRRLGPVQGTESTDNLGDTAAARGSLAKATRLLDDIRRADPKAQEPLIMAVDTYGDLALLESDAAAASRADATRLALLGELERQNPTDVDSLMDIADGYSNAGIFRAEHRELDGARRYYGDAVRIYEAIVARSVPRARWTRPYTLALKRLGAVEMVKGALADSERHYRQALALEMEQLRADPTNLQWPFERTYTLSDLGLLAQRQGRRDEAIRLWTEARGIRAQALADNPKNVRRLHAMAVITVRLGRIRSRWRRLCAGGGLLPRGSVAARAAGRRATRPAPAAHRPGVGTGEPRHFPAAPGSRRGSAGGRGSRRRARGLPDHRPAPDRRPALGRGRGGAAGGLSHAGRPPGDGLSERLRSEARLRSRSLVRFDSEVVLSGAELAQVMIHVQVGPAQPRPLRHPPEDRMRAATARRRHRGRGCGRAALPASPRRRRTSRRRRRRSA